jgi:NADPH-dependent F420 reductase
MNDRTVIAVLGGTGSEGSGLAFRWAWSGHEVVIGSRSPERAARTADELRGLLGGRGRVRSAGNREAAGAGSIVVLAVPYAAQIATAIEVRDELDGKVLVDVTVPLVPPRSIACSCRAASRRPLCCSDGSALA